MKISRILYGQRFLRAARGLTAEQKTLLVEKEKIFRKNCFDTRPKTHKLSGKLKNYWSFSISYSHRVVFEFLESGTVGFVDIGDHSIYQ